MSVLLACLALSSMWSLTKPLVAGKSTFLAVLLRMLQAWLKDDEDKLVEFISIAMYTSSNLRLEQLKVVRDFLAALRGLARRQMLFLLRCVIQSLPRLVVVLAVTPERTSCMSSS